MSFGDIIRALSSIALASRTACFFLEKKLGPIKLLGVVDVNHVIDHPLDYAYCLELIWVFVFGEFDFGLLKYALDPVQIVFLHFDQGLRDEPVVNACLVELLELLSLVQVRKGSL